MESKIRILSEQTINKIAAGEVIENPSSVVKELVENSLDAGASEITVEIKGGGRQLIRVSDNGCGMNPDDALLCLERHATSKIKSVEDLHNLYTMGFRGEAIPSIAAISKFSLLTCPQNEEKGTRVTVDGGRIISSSSVPCPAGTILEVKDLFFNVPVRKKFQRSPAYDVQEIQKMLTLLALGYPTIKFTLISNQETLLSTTRTQKSEFIDILGERIENTLGSEYLRGLIPLEGTKETLHLQGFIGLPAYTRHNRTGQYLFINKRGVVSPLISYAVREGFGPMLSTNRYPIFVLHLGIPGSFVDVNVHPQKREVRLRQELRLKELVIHSVEKALHQTESCFEERRIPSPFPKTVYVPPPPKFELHFRPEPAPRQEEETLFKELSPQNVLPRALATISGYIIVDSKTIPKFSHESLCVVDQNLAHSRILFEKLSRKEVTGVIQQTLLIPYTLEVSPTESALLKDYVECFNQVGIGIKEFGPHTFLIDALPPFFGNTDVGELIGDLLKKVREYHDLDAFQRDHKRAIALSASRAAVSKNSKLSIEEAQKLMNQLMQCENPYQCPQGKTTMIQIGPDELAKQFI